MRAPPFVQCLGTIFGLAAMLTLGQDLLAGRHTHARDMNPAATARQAVSFADALLGVLDPAWQDPGRSA
jgi:hypothetical protein